jgi:transposase-like protein
MAESLSVVRRFLWPMDAEVAASILRARGVECAVADTDILSWCSFYSVALGGVRLQVQESKIAEAAEILQWAYRQEEMRCPNCDSADLLALGRSGWTVLALCAWSLVPCHPLKRKWGCQDCSFTWKSRSGGDLTSASLAWGFCTLVVLSFLLWFCRWL